MSLMIYQTSEKGFRLAQKSKNAVFYYSKKGLMPTKLHTPPLEDFGSFKYREYARSRYLCAVTKHLIAVSFRIIRCTPHHVSVGYYSGEQHLARLWDNVLVRGTHPSIRPPECRGCLGPRICLGSIPAYCSRWRHCLVVDPALVLMSGRLPG